MKYLGFFILILSSISSADEITVKSDYWYPYNGLPTETKQGYAVEIMKQALKDHGHTLNYQLMDWGNSIKSVREGKDNCVIGALKSEAEDFIFTKEPIGYYQAVFFGRRLKYNWKYENIESLKGKIIGVIEGYNYTNELDAYIADNKNSPAVFIAKGELPLNELTHLLRTDKIDFIIESPEVFFAEIKRRRLRLDIKEYDRTGDKKKLYIACSPKLENSKEIVSLIDNKIRAMRKDNSLEKLLQRYGIDGELSLMSN